MIKYNVPFNLSGNLMFESISRCGPGIRMADTTRAQWSVSMRKYLPGLRMPTDHSPTRLTPS